ncbi:hypothetical protein POSPLADRAFT_1032494 [Postia placenta MAD-698-R-SB12]|uniref:Uncharacterized protein n=1 Tax=Postia placenta MAD-698-R-SB12 TaxID=670580 RepID=A0A1X6N5W9_9APHY|nr:hypothetical protein POSPLADRAFT_1032494 [Postia placenta MAD-698-R-SB12]OSX64007.1 hypothetical protein POSPLADRAFT_1032494 [Postia placenta MAD-698-R-SB12]
MTTERLEAWQLLTAAVPRDLCNTSGDNNASSVKHNVLNWRHFAANSSIIHGGFIAATCRTFGISETAPRVITWRAVLNAAKPILTVPSRIQIRLPEASFSRQGECRCENMGSGTAGMPRTPDPTQVDSGVLDSAMLKIPGYALRHQNAACLSRGSEWLNKRRKKRLAIRNSHAAAPTLEFAATTS